MNLSAILKRQAPNRLCPGIFEEKYYYFYLPPAAGPAVIFLKTNTTQP